MKDHPDHITRPSSTGWLIFMAGGALAGFGAFLVIGVVQTDVRALWSYPFTAVYAPFLLFGIAAMVWGWRLATTLKTMLEFTSQGINLGRMRGASMTPVLWSDLAMFEIWRPYALSPGQRDQISIGLTETAAGRLGLQEPRSDPNSPGHTGTKPPQRKHFAYNAAHLSIGADDLQSRIAQGVEGAGGTVVGPHTVHIGVAARYRWTFERPEDADTTV